MSVSTGLEWHGTFYGTYIAPTLYSLALEHALFAV